MHWISNKFIHEQITFKELIEALKTAFQKTTIESPPKSLYNYKGIGETESNTFLFMPSWDNKKFFGTKLLTATPGNSSKNIPYIQGTYLLFDAQNGKPLMGMDAKLITNYRTAATSALAALYLAPKKVNSILIIGNGTLTPYFIKAHSTIRKYNKIYLWGLRKAPSEGVKQKLKKESIDIEIIDDFRHISKQADVISCITSSKSALLSKKDLGTGQHIDLVGSFTEDMHEVTTDVITSCAVYTDNTNSTPCHAGELVKAMKEGVFTINDIQGDLSYLCSKNMKSRKNNKQNTLFKSTGMALEDLVMARLIYEKHKCCLNN